MPRGILLPAFAASVTAVATVSASRAMYGPVPVRRACSAITSPCTVGPRTRAITTTAGTPWRSVASKCLQPYAAWYPASGFRSVSNGRCYTVGESGYVWSGSCQAGVQASCLHQSRTFVYLLSLANRGDCVPVRCVQAFTALCRVVSCYRLPFCFPRGTRRGRFVRLWLVVFGRWESERLLHRHRCRSSDAGRGDKPGGRFSGPLRPSVCSRLLVLLPATALACLEFLLRSVPTVIPGRPRPREA